MVAMGFAMVHTPRILVVFPELFPCSTLGSCPQSRFTIDTYPGQASAIPKT